MARDQSKKKTQPPVPPVTFRSVQIIGYEQVSTRQYASNNKRHNAVSSNPFDDHSDDEDESIGLSSQKPKRKGCCCLM